MRYILIVLSILTMLFSTTSVANANVIPEYQKDYIEAVSKEYGLSSTLVYGVIMAESNFDCKADSGSSKGLMQLNKNTYPTLAKELGIEDFDVFDFEDNALAGIYKLALERDYWLEQGYSDEDTFSAMLISYNRGRAGAKRYIAKHGLNNSYVDKVLGYKCEFEQDGVI